MANSLTVLFAAAMLLYMVTFTFGETQLSLHS